MAWPGSDDVTDRLTSWEDATTYNNFYEFGTGKDDPVRNAHTLRTDPWSVRVDGECDRGGNYTLEDILAPHALEERDLSLSLRGSLVHGGALGGLSTGRSAASASNRIHAPATCSSSRSMDRQQMPGQRYSGSGLALS
jgi:methionine sulfoxide reductase catalytic subunit